MLRWGRRGLTSILSWQVDIGGKLSLSKIERSGRGQGKEGEVMKCVQILVISISLLSNETGGKYKKEKPIHIY